MVASTACMRVDVAVRSCVLSAAQVILLFQFFLCVLNIGSLQIIFRYINSLFHDN